MKITIKIFTIFSLMLTLSYCAYHNKKIGYYRDQGQNLIKMINRGSAQKELVQESLNLMVEGIAVARKFAARYPECNEYLSYAIEQKDSMISLSLEEIEQLYHADGGMPPAPDHCYDVKDLIVHPATVIVLLHRHKTSPQTQKQDRQQMLGELVEVLDHVDNVATQL